LIFIKVRIFHGSEESRLSMMYSLA